jgi:heterodisulfide reductase subunit A
MSERVGVFICHCGRNISSTVDVKKIAQEIPKHPKVVHSEDYKYMCSEIGQKMVKDAIKSKKLTAIVVAACSPSLHEQTFRRACESAGLNPYKCEMANIREQCSWVHDDVEKATGKAFKIIRSMINKVVDDKPLSPIMVGVKKRCLVIGAGIAGIQAALDVANAGIPVSLVEKSSTIGGRMAQLSETFPTLDCAQCILTPKMAEVAHHPNVQLLTLSEVVSVNGYVGNFHVKIREKPRYVDQELCNLCGDCVEVCPVFALNEYEKSLNIRRAIYLPFPQAVPSSYTIDSSLCLGLNPLVCAKCIEVCEPKAIDPNMSEKIVEEDFGVIIVATGYDVYPKEKIGEYGYGLIEDVIDSLQFERILSSTGPTGGEIRRPSDGKPVKKIAFIQCAGSRDKNYLEYCSKVCCMYTAKHAILFKHRVPEGEAYVFYIDVRTGGKGYEEFYERAQTEHKVVYIKSKPSKVYLSRRENPVVVAVDLLTNRKIELEVDMLVLATGMVPSMSSELASELKIPLDENGFVQEVHPKLRPVECTSEGIFICGVVHGPKDISESVAQASATASKAIALLSKDKILHEPVIAGIIEELCTGCGLCITACPYDAIKVEEGTAKVTEVLCTGCGACVSTCPCGAIAVKNFKDETFYEMISEVTGVGPK